MPLAQLDAYPATYPELSNIIDHNRSDMCGVAYLVVACLVTDGRSYVGLDRNRNSLVSLCTMSLDKDARRFDPVTHAGRSADGGCRQL
jgi:hypothetical protein